MATTSTSFVAGLLRRTNLFNDEQIARLLEGVKQPDANITELVVRENYAEEVAFLEAVSATLRIPFLRLVTQDIEKEVLEKLPTKAVFQYNVIPISLADGALTVATNNPLTTGLVDTLRLAAGTRVRFALSPAADIARASRKFYGVGADTLDRMMEDDRFDLSQFDDTHKSDLSDLDQEASIVKFVNQIIREAVQQGATDIHLEPMEDKLRIRYRIDGVLHQTPVPPQLHRFQAAIISRIKVMANLDIAEKRLPMDGRIGLRVDAEDIDIRVSTMPTVYGESVSLRLLQRKDDFVSLLELGLCPSDQQTIQKLINRPNGIILVTGPTGSGKSTSLYAFLHEINTIDQRIMTAEDPIEYEMAGINQVLVRADIGLTFAKALRSFLRQDPDIIMVGEIRDQETAEIAIQSSLTGHLVFSTLHTNDAAGTFTRLLDMGVEPFLVASAVEAVVAQRLVRRLCRDCRSPVKPDLALLRDAGFPVDRMPGHTIYETKGCERCRMTGFRGRVGIFELLTVTDEIEALIVQRASMNVIKQKAVEQGMWTLRDDGWRKVLDGVTTVEEVARATEENQ